MGSKHPFNLSHYAEIISVGIRAGYKWSTFCTKVASNEKNIFLRHDIDNDISAAHRMARLESGLGVHATYLVMLRSSNYNPAEGRNIRMLQQMAEMGHDLGLHFSLVDHPKPGRAEDLAGLIRRDAELLGSLLGCPIPVFGFHNPADDGQYKIEVPGLVNTYAAEFFDEAYYLSESNMRWRKGCPCETLSACSHHRVQLLVHPLSFAEELSSDRDVLIHFLRLKLEDLLDYNVSQNRVLREEGIRVADCLEYLRRRKDPE